VTFDVGLEVVDVDVAAGDCQAGEGACASDRVGVVEGCGDVDG